MLEYDSDNTPLHAAFFDALPLPSIVHGHTTLVAVNAAARRLLDFDRPEDIEGLPIAAIVHPEDRGAVHGQRGLPFERGDRTGVPVMLVTRSGRTVKVTVAGAHFRVGASSAAVVICCEAGPGARPEARDDAPPQFAEGTLPVKAALDILPLPVIATRERTVAYVNRAAAYALRAPSCEALTGCTLSEIVHPDALASLLEQLALVLTNAAVLGPVPVKARAVDGTSVCTRGHGRGLRHGGAHYAIFLATEVDWR